MNKEWYSSKIRIAYLVEDSFEDFYWDSLFLIKSNSFDNAHSKALEIGYGLEKVYQNANQKLVHVKFKEILTLDFVGEITDKCEVLCDKSKIPKSVNKDINSKYLPENSKPEQTL